MTAMATNPRSITDVERPFVIRALTAEQQLDIVKRVRGLGYADSIALGLAGWLAVKAAGGEDRTSSRTRATYRRVLGEVIAAAGTVDAMRVYLKLAGEAA
jgi:hypothetical protein